MALKEHTRKYLELKFRNVHALITKKGQYLTLHGFPLNRAKRPDHSKTYDNMTATTCFMEFIFLTEREKPIDESDVDSDGEIDSESTGIGNSINNKV